MELLACRCIKHCWHMVLILLLAGSSCARAVTAAPDDVLLTENLPFCNGQGASGQEVLHLDMARPRALTQSVPVVLLVHGGGWSGGSRRDYRHLMFGLAQQGVVGVSVDYRLTPANRFPAPLEDVKCAVRWIRAHAVPYQFDTRRIVAVGGSAGAHLVAMLGTTAGIAQFEGQGGFAQQSSHIDAMVLHGGPYDLLQLARDFTANPMPGRVGSLRALTQLLGATHLENPQAYLGASPSQYATHRSASALLLHGALDPLVPYQEAQRFDALLRSKGVRSEALIIQGAGHGDFGSDPGPIVQQFMAFVRGRL